MFLLSVFLNELGMNVLELDLFESLQNNRMLNMSACPYYGQSPHDAQVMLIIMPPRQGKTCHDLQWEV